MGKGLADHDQFIPLGVGLETEIADKLVQPGSVTTIENALPRNTGEVIGRQGYYTLSASNQATRPANGVLPHVHRLATLDGGLVRYNAAPVPLHSWDAAAEEWVAPSSTTITSYRTGPMSVSTDPVFEEVPGTDNVEVCDIIVIGARRITAFEYTSGANTAVHLVVQDITTNTQVFSKTYTAGTLRPRLWAGTTSFALVYNNAGTINVDIFDVALFTFDHVVGNPCEADSVIAIRDGGFDVDADFSVLYQILSAPGYIGARVSEISIAAGGAIEDDYLVTTVTAPVSGLADCSLALNWMKDGAGGGKVAIIMASTTFGLYVLWDLQAPTAGSAHGTLQRLDNAATAAPVTTTEGIRNVCGTITLGSIYRVLYEVAAPDLASRCLIKEAVWTGSATLSTPYRSICLRSELWKYNSGTAAGSDYYFLACQPADEQKTYFVVKLDNGSAGLKPTPHGTAFVRSAGGLTGKTSHLSSVAVGPDGEFIVAATHDTRIESTAPSGTATGATANIRAVDAISTLHRTTPDTELGIPVEFAGQLFSPGGTLLGFDGQTYGLPGFCAYPPEPGAVTSGGGNLDPGVDYAWVAVYCYIDRQGRKWRSAPSVPHETSMGADTKATLSADCLRMVDRASYFIEFYRTQADAPGAYFLVCSVANDPAQDSVSIIDNVADVDLGEELYTDGGGLENQLLPPVSHVTTIDGRLVVAEAGTATLWDSLEIDLNHGLIFNEALTFDIDNPSDPITGLATLGTSVIAFKSGKVYARYGQGGDALGRGQTYQWRLLDGSVGCINATSILQTVDGIFFQSTSKRAGMHVVTPGLDVQYIGQGVRKYNDLTVTAAVVVRAKSQYRFYTSQGRTFVFHTATKSWTTDTSQACLHATSTYSDSDGATYANATGFQVLNEDNGSVDEGPYLYSPKIRSPWLQIAGMKGWERVKNILGAGTAGGAHRVIMRLYKDYDETTPFATYVKQFDGTETKWDWQQRPKIQKLSALMIELEIGPYTAAVDPVTTTGPGILGVTLRIGTKKGPKKMGARMTPV